MTNTEETHYITIVYADGPVEGHQETVNLYNSEGDLNNWLPGDHRPVYAYGLRHFYKTAAKPMKNGKFLAHWVDDESLDEMLRRIK